MTTFKNNMVGAGVALVALVLLAVPVFFAQAADIDTGWYADSYTDSFGGSFDDSTGWYADSYTDSYGASYDDSTGWYADSYTDSYPSSYSDSTGWYADSYTDSYLASSGGYSSGYSGGSSFSMPSFANQSYRTGGGYPVFPSYPQQPVKPSNTTVTTNTCVNDSCNYVDNSIVDNSVKISNSFNNQKKQKEEYRDDCYNTYNYGYNNCYQQPRPIAYNTTPYITLSQAPYTGLDLGPMGEVLYWTFLVLWCLGAAYLIVVKRVQNKLVSFLNGFLFGSTASAAHAAHTPVSHTHAVASAPLVEEGIDPFIQSQIKRS